MQNSFLSVFKYRDFKKIWLAQVFSQVALNMLIYSLVLHIFDLTRSTASISLVMIASALPAIIFGNFSGALADRLNLRRILIYTNFFRFLAVLLLFISNDNVLALLEIIFVISSISQFFAPAELSSTPLIVPKEKLISANSITMTTMYATLLVGYSIAGPIILFLNIKWLFFLAACFYLLASLITSKLSEYDVKTTRHVNLAKIASDIEEVWGEVKNGWHYVREHKKIFHAIIKLAAGWAVLGSFIVLLPAFGESVLEIEKTLIGPMIIAPAGFGMVVGAFILGKRRGYDYFKIMNKGFLLVSVALIVFTAFPLYERYDFARILSTVSVVCLGFGASTVYISAQTLLHLNSHEDKRGRVFGLVAMLISLATSLPALVIGGVADLTNPLITMILIVIVVSIYSLSLVFEEE